MGEVRMLEDISSRRPRSGIEEEHSLQELESLGGDTVGVFFLESRGDALGGAEEFVPHQFRDTGPFAAGRGAEDGVDFVQLVDFAAVAGEDGVPGEDLDEDACGGPDVHGGAVLRLTQQQFRGAVPDGDDAVSVVLLPPLLVESGQAKVGKLQGACLGDEDVGSFDIAVQNAATMEVVETLEHLAGEIFLVCGCEGEGWMVEQTSQVVGEILEHHEAVISLHHDLLQRDYIVVVQTLQEFDLTRRGNGKAIPLAFHTDLLECNLAASINMDTFVDFAVSTRPNHRLIASLAVIDRFAGFEVVTQLWSGFQSLLPDDLLFRGWR